ncbi:colicin immunity protein [Salmonella enterica]|uniref:colicin immunity domain-containing protein n=1 Tax=Salmonella enterica TaxID=28901 RepID=UPI0009AD529D|nr:colicin immunity domain-containing protein [Salmonella enterica]EJG5923171.1 colicin immunity protein [Salmonella enterica]ELX2843913.1 colicin immunity protein [Salmonella enterica]
MSEKLIELARELVSKELSADGFETQFFKLWRSEGQQGQLAKDSENVGACAAELFILADCYTSEPERRYSELDEEGLRKEVRSTLEKYNLL